MSKDAISVELFTGFLGLMGKIHGNRLISPEFSEILVPRLLDLENAYLNCELKPVKRKRKTNKKETISE